MNKITYTEKTVQQIFQLFTAEGFVEPPETVKDDMLRDLTCLITDFRLSYKDEKAKEKCGGYDAGLKESARLEIRRPNKFICICIHCRQQAVAEAEIKHTKDCCFFPPSKQP